VTSMLRTALPALLASLLLLGACSHRPSVVEAFLRRGGLDGWDQTTPLTVYGPDHLFQYMNGEAEVYLPLGFRRLYTATYASPDSEALLTVEAYDMGSAAAAEAVLERYSGGEGKSVPNLGAASWTDGWVVLFVRGMYFLRVWGAPETPVPPSPGEARALARLVEDAVAAGRP